MNAIPIEPLMKILRDLRQVTKLLILLEVAKNPSTKLKTIAERLDMTVQGVSEYIQRMREEGLIQTLGGYRPTVRGVQFLQGNIQELKRFVEESWKRTMIITSCTALAMTKITRGQRVGLFMNNGILCAYSGRRSSSTGVADVDARPGDIVSIRDLEGIVELTPGKIRVIEISGRSLAKNPQGYLADVRKLIRGIDALVIVHGLEAQVVAERLNLKIDARFGSIEAAIDACRRGVDVLFLCSEGLTEDLLNRVKEENSLREEKIQVAQL